MLALLLDSQVRNAKYDSKRSRTILPDAKGLCLEVMKSGRKIWRLRTWTNGKEKVVTLGEYPFMPLTEARSAAAEYKARLKNGCPAEPEKPPTRTFKSLAEEWLEKKMRPVRVPTHVETIEQRLKLHIYPYIEDLPVTELSPAVILPLLRRIESAGKIETAYRVHNIISQVMRYGVALSEVEHDFMPDLRGALQAKRTDRHFAALTETNDIAAFLRACDLTPSLITRYGMFFNAYTIVRPNELRRAEWREIDFTKSEWVIPAEKMKMRREHVVPLSRQALEILQKLKPYTEQSVYIFPQSRNFSKPMSECTILVEIKKTLRRAELPENSMTWHGFRAMASTHLNAQGWNIDAIERQLAHSNNKDVRFAYNRHEYMDIRREMMQSWADWLDELKKIPPKQK